MSTNLTELERFRDFIDEKIANGSSTLSLEEACRLFREEGRTSSHTPLGKRLREIRKDIVESGEPLLNLTQLQQEVAERRGEHQS